MTDYQVIRTRRTGRNELIVYIPSDCSREILPPQVQLLEAYWIVSHWQRYSNKRKSAALVMRRK